MGWQDGGRATQGHKRIIILKQNHFPAILWGRCLPVCVGRSETGIVGENAFAQLGGARYGSTGAGGTKPCLICENITKGWTLPPDEDYLRYGPSLVTLLPGSPV